MELLLDFDTVDPPTGRLRNVTILGEAQGRADPVPFCGWLGLIRALSEGLENLGCGRPAGR